ncbi:MAG: lipocalin-like domain-containing protein, partial [Chloroflexi bacterium]|nr:lipocalin-like domain-containing protein [Chloroflexota bacterium]
MRVVFVALLATMSAGLFSACVAPESGAARPDTAAALVGTWRLVSFESRTAGGEIRHQLGRAPRGQLLYDAAGHMSAQLMDPERPQFASGDPTRG